METKDKQYVLEMVKKHDVKFIRLWFTDILGFLKSFAITVEELEMRSKRVWVLMVRPSKALPE